MRRAPTSSLFALMALASVGVGCGNEPSPPPSDAGVTLDGGAGLGDVGATLDGGSPLDTGPMSDTGSDFDTGAESDTGSASDSGSVSDSGPELDAGAPDAPFVTSGTFRFLSYNVAGLPDLLSGSDPAVNTPMMSPLLNAYDIVVAQEDFSYHAALIGAATHGFISGPSAAPAGRTFGDGLGRLSVFPFPSVERQQWTECNGVVGSGTDCLAGKGFSLARHELNTGLVLHVYDLHMDAGRSSADAAARTAQVRQLVAYMSTHSSAATVIVAGDTNLKEEDEALVLELLSTASLIDVCRSLSCPDPGGHDRVMYRNAPGLELTPTRWQEDPRFVDGAGEPLSDHPAIGVDFDWRRTP